MSWLVGHDVWPGLSAHDAPLIKASDWLKGEGQESQFAVFNDAGRLGTIWTEYRIDAKSIQRFDLIWIDGTGLEIFPLRMSLASIFAEDGTLDDLTVLIDSHQGRIRLHGERFPSDFSFTLETGASPRPKTLKVPLARGDIISGAFNPFAYMDDVYVGQRWRQQVFNPVAALTGVGDRFIPMVVSVTGKEQIATDAGVVDCFVVEAARAKAWVDARGAVRLQEMTLPVVGKIRIVREAKYDAAARRRARSADFDT